MKDGVRLADRSTNPILPGETIRPLREILLVRPLDLPLGSKIIAPFKGETVRGEVVAAGPGRYPWIYRREYRDGKEVRTRKESKQFVPTTVKVGDIVQLGGMELGGYLWKHVQVDGIDHVICSEQDVAFIEA